MVRASGALLKRTGGRPVNSIKQKRALRASISAPDCKRGESPLPKSGATYRTAELAPRQLNSRSA